MEPIFTIKKIIFNSEKFYTKSKLEIEPGNLMVIVGPNNSGKTRVLEDIKTYLTSENKMQLLSEVVLEPSSTKDEFINSLKKFEKSGTEDPTNDFINLFRPSYSKSKDPINFTTKYAQIDSYYNDHIHSTGVIPQISNLTTFSLDAITRFELLRKQENTSYEQPQNFFGLIYNNDELRENIRDQIYNEFGYYFYLDTKHPPGQISIKLSGTRLKGTEKSEEIGDVKEIGKLLPISNYGHGVQAFSSILITVSSSPCDIILIDEPEAFLHPPQALHLGRSLSNITEQRKGSTIIVTHSPEILMGCVENSNVTILRITYDKKLGTVKQIDPKLLLELNNTPKLRSTSLFDSFFYKYSIVVEGDSDRVFYSEINRIIEKKGIDDTKFLGSFGKHSIVELVTPLRKIGIPTVAVYDFDSIKHIENFPFNRHLKQMGIPNSKIQYVEKERKFIETKFAELDMDKKEFYQKSGLESLSGDDLDRAKKFLDFLKKYGIFILPKGSMESWVKELDLPSGNKQLFVERFLDLIKNKNNRKKIRLKDNDVAKFIYDIKKWVEDPKRLGMEI